MLRKLASDTAIYGLSNILNRLLSYIALTPFLTRIFAHEQAAYGVMSVLFAYAGLLTVVLTCRMDTAFFRFGRTDTDRDRAFSAAVLAIAVVVVPFVSVMLLGGGIFATWLHMAGHPEYFWWLAGIVGFDVLAAVPFARLRLENRAVWFATVKFLNIVVNVSALYFLLKICPDAAASGAAWAKTVYAPEWRVSYIFIANLLASAVTLALLAPAFSRIIWRFDAAKVREMLAYSSPLIVVGLAGMVNEVADRTLLQYFLAGDDAARQSAIGIYSACYKLPTLMMIVTTGFNYAAEPFFFSNADRKDATTIYAKVTLAYTIVAAGASLGVLLYLDVLQYIIAPSYRSGLGIVPVLLLANVCFGLYSNVSVWYKLRDQTRIGAYIALASAALTLVVNIIGIPLYGYMASAVATLVCYAFLAVTTYALGQRYYPVPYSLPRIGGYIALAAILYGVSLAIKAATGTHLATNLAVNTLLLAGFGAVAFFFERRNLRAV